MGLHFGELYKLRIITFRLSPFEMRAYAGFFSHGLPNLIRRTIEEVPYVVPTLAIGYVVYIAIDGYHAQMGRKNPADYADDK